MKSPKLTGVYPYSDNRPTFGLPVFRFGSEWLIQRPTLQNEGRFSFYQIDPSDVEGKIILTKLNADTRELLFAYIGVGDQVEIGSRTQVGSRLTHLAKGGSGNAIALQAAEIMGLEDDRRSALAKLARSIKNRSGERASKSFTKSAALSIAWDHIQHSDIDDSNKRRVLSQLHMIKINIDGINPNIDVSSIDEEIRHFINVDAIIAALKRDITDPILEVADNDKGSEYDISAQISKTRQVLNERLGPDKRMTSSSYYRLIKLAGMMGVHGIEEIMDITKDYNDVQISDLATGARQGQTSRVELMLMAALGDDYIRRYPYYTNEYLRRHHMNILENMKKAGINIGTRSARHPTSRKFGTIRKRASPPPPSLFAFDDGDN